MLVYPDAVVIPSVSKGGAIDPARTLFGPGSVLARNPIIELQLWVGDLGLNSGATQNVNALDTARMQPYFADAHVLLGRIHLRNGRVQEAIAAFKIALWSAETAEVHVALGEAYREAKDPDAARAEAERALALDPASADAKALLKRLDSRE